VLTYKTCFATVESDLISILKLYLGYLGNDKVVFISFVFDMFRILKNIHISYEFICYSRNHNCTFVFVYFCIFLIS
jgi:hypothetical protein